ncbi:oxygenase MpaB family protein [Tsukamurella pulmonis]|uniref:oxygenase MpaB family protein n=1 Tax=Tsukamurella pulmonis TaxID=47312 RepID=UPI0009E818A0|nr:oxygenase MpaB family protein [Tsukamurella pulmonis]
MTASAEPNVTIPATGTAAPSAPARTVDPVAQGYRIPVAAPPRPAHLLTTLADAADAGSLAAGAANVVMQLLNRPVAYGVMESPVESGALYKHPIKRTRTTLTYLAVAVLGTPDDKVRYREAVNTAHRQVHSTAASPVKYNAMDRGLQLWVAMCLYVGFEDTHQLLRGRMDREQRALFYRDSAPLGTTLQVPAELWPATPEEFDATWVELCAKKITPDEDTRAYLRQLVDLTFVGTLPGPLKAFNRFLTAGFLAPRFREAMEIEWTARDQHRFDRFWRAVALANGILPLALRRLPYRLLLADLRLRAKLGRPLV